MLICATFDMIHFMLVAHITKHGGHITKHGGHITKHCVQ